MTPDQLRALADLFEQSHPAPRGDMRMTEYIVADCTQAMAQHLRTLAGPVPPTQPPISEVQDEMLHEQSPGFPHISDYIELSGVIRSALPPMFTGLQGSKLAEIVAAAIFRAGYRKQP